MSSSDHRDIFLLIVLTAHVGTLGYQWAMPATRSIARTIATAAEANSSYIVVQRQIDLNKTKADATSTPMGMADAGFLNGIGDQFADAASEYVFALERKDMELDIGWTGV